MPNPSDTALNVAAVDSGSRKRDFLRLPTRLYRNDPCWVAPLELELRERIWGSNPFLHHASVQTWVAYRADTPVGRISAQFDRLQQEVQGGATGSFGLFEAENDSAVAGALMTAAADWLRGFGATLMRGPFNLSVNEECGLLVSGFDTPPSIMMGHGLDYYDALIRTQGLSPVRDLLAYRVAPDFVAPRVMQRLADGFRDRVTVRTLDQRDTKRELETLRDVFNDAWSENFGFVPFTREEFADIGKLVAFLVPPEYVQIAEVDGVPAAFIVAMPNINEVTRSLGGRLLPFGWLKLLWGVKIRHPRSARVPLMGVRKQFQHSRLGPALAFLVIDAVRKGLCARKVHEVEMSWILEDNSGMRNIIESIGGELYKSYRLYEKAI
jgi:hypothetical protein